MESIIFVSALGIALTFVLAWGFKNLPGESWQFFASVPSLRKPLGVWDGINFTYYGFIIACSTAFSVSMAIFLLGCVSARISYSLMIIIIMMAICVPASRIVAGIVEKKKHTFTVGGALFVGVIILPWAAWAVRKIFGPETGIEVLPFCAAMSVAYGFGEGLGRLACISFGCCYGKPLNQAPPLLQRLLRGKGFVFSGKTKKVSYADGLDEQKIIPVQAMTASIYCAISLLGVYLFLNGAFGSAMLLVLIVTQVWRIYSETLRADYRGEGRISAYQIMMCAAVVYSALLPLVFPASHVPGAELINGWRSLWTPGTILALQGMWLAAFVFYGKSTVTQSNLTFYVVEDRI